MEYNVTQNNNYDATVETIQNKDFVLTVAQANNFAKMTNIQAGYSGVITSVEKEFKIDFAGGDDVYNFAQTELFRLGIKSVWNYGLQRNFVVIRDLRAGSENHAPYIFDTSKSMIALFDRFQQGVPRMYTSLEKRNLFGIYSMQNIQDAGGVDMPLPVFNNKELPDDDVNKYFYPTMLLQVEATTQPVSNIRFYYARTFTKNKKGKVLVNNNSNLQQYATE
jgi:hypothetical protein